MSAATKLLIRCVALLGYLTLAWLLTRCQPEPITPAPVMATIQVTSPLPGQIFQRDNRNKAVIPVLFKTVYDPTETPTGKSLARVRLVPVQGGAAMDWVTLSADAGEYRAGLTAVGGDYRLDIDLSGGTVAKATVDRVGVGEVFAIWGHSVAQGDDFAIYDNPDPRVRCVNFSQPDFEINALPLAFTPVSTTTKIGPYGNGPYAWAMLGNKLAASLNVPILLFNSAFGGSQVQQNYQVIKNIPFDHGFIKYNRGMPYKPFRAILERYLPVTGLRAVLVHHGVNDRGNSREVFKQHLQTVIEYTRQTVGMPALAFLLAHEDAGAAIDVSHINAAIADVIQTTPNTYPGANVEVALRAQRADREDKIHMQPVDWASYSEAWKGAVLTSIGRCQPIPATLPPNLPTLGAGLSSTLAVWYQSLPPVTAENLALVLFVVGACGLFALGRRAWAIVPGLFALVLVSLKLGKQQTPIL